MAMTEQTRFAEQDGYMSDQFLAVERPLIAEGQTGNDAAVTGEALEMHRRHLMNYAASRTDGDRQTAEDVVQESFVRALQHRQSFVDQGVGYGPFLFRTAHNVFVDITKKGGKKQVTSIDQTDESELNRMTIELPADEVAEQSQEAKLALSAIEHIISSLQGTNRETFTDHFIRGLSRTDLIRILGISEKAVDGRIYRAKEAAKQALKAIDIDCWPPSF